MPSEPEDLRGVIIDWAGVLTNPLRRTVRAWADAEGIDWDSYAACMRGWLDDAYHADAVGNPVHALERGECTVEEFEQILAARLLRLDGGTVPAPGLLGRMFAASLTVPVMYDMLRQLRAAGSAPACCPTPGGRAATPARTSRNCSTPSSSRTRWACASRSAGSSCTPPS